MGPKWRVLCLGREAVRRVPLHVSRLEVGLMLLGGFSGFPGFKYRVPENGSSSSL